MYWSELGREKYCFCTDFDIIFPPCEIGGEISKEIQLNSPILRL